MRTTFARRVAATSCAAALLMLPAAGVGLAEPDAAGDSAPASGGLPVSLVEALDRDLGIDAQQFLDWSDAAQLLADASAELRREFPTVFGGAWLDQGTPTVGVVTTPDGPADSPTAQAAAVLRDGVRALGFATKDVAKSEAALRAELAGVQSWIASLPEPVAAAFRGAIIDLANNQMVIGLATSDFGDVLNLPDMLRSARVLFTPANEIVPSDPVIDTAPLADTEQADGGESEDEGDGSAMLGGDAFLVGSDAGQFRCSLGFNAVGPGGETLNITAGHCNPDGDGAAGNPATFLGGPEAGTQFGTFAKTRLIDIDYGIVAVDEPYRERFESPAVRGSGVPLTGTADPVVGMPVCKSGVTTGYSCGLVTSTNLRVDIGARRLVNGFTASICALQGDSGGTIVSGTHAVGVSSASDVGDYRNCAEAFAFTALFGDTPQLYGVPINDVLAENPGVTLRVE